MLKGKKYLVTIVLVMLSMALLLTSGCSGSKQSANTTPNTATPSGKHLMVFAGAASQPPMELAAKAFEQKTGVRVDTVFGGSGYVLSQMKLGKKGDLYFPGSSDFMEIAKRDGAVYPETEQKIVYLVNAIN